MGWGVVKSEAHELHPCHVANGQSPLGGCVSGGCNDRREAQGVARRARP